MNIQTLVYLYLCPSDREAGIIDLTHLWETFDPAYKIELYELIQEASNHLN